MHHGQPPLLLLLLLLLLPMLLLPTVLLSKVLLSTVLLLLLPYCDCDCGSGNGSSGCARFNALRHEQGAVAGRDRTLVVCHDHRCRLPRNLLSVRR